MDVEHNFDAVVIDVYMLCSFHSLCTVSPTRDILLTCTRVLVAKGGHFMAKAVTTSLGKLGFLILSAEQLGYQAIGETELYVCATDT